MPTTKKPVMQPTPKIEWLELKELTVEDGFNVREEKSMERNTKELADHISALGYIDPSIHCVQYVDKGGKKMIRNGHTLHAAAKIAGLKQVPAIKTKMDSTQELVNLVVSNTGHPLSLIEQGAVYVRLRDGGDVTAAKVGEEIRAPMSATEIASLVGYTVTHVRNCLALRESTPEIRELLLTGKVNANAITAARSGLNDKPKKILEILEAAIKQAESQGKTCATDKHVKEIKAQFVEPKLKAGKTVETPPETFKKPDKKTPEPAASFESIGGNEKPQTAEPAELELEHPPEVVKSIKKETINQLVEIIEQWQKDGETPKNLAERILKDVLPF